MSLPFTLNTAQEWLDNIPPFLLSLDPSSEFVSNDEIPEYLASTLLLFFNQAPHEFGRKAIFILENASDPGKYVFLKTLLGVSEIWADLIKIEGVHPALTELALTTDKIFSETAFNLSKKLEEVASEIFRVAAIEESLITPVGEEFDSFDESELSEKSSLSSGAFGLSEPKAKKKARALSPPGAVAPKSQPLPAMMKEVKPAPPPAPSPAPITEKTSLPQSAPFELEEEEDSAKMDDFSSDFELKKEDRLAKPLSEPISADSTVTDSKQIFTHVHYYSRMNSHKIYPFTVSLSSFAKKVMRQRIGNIISGEREAETQADFELSGDTYQIMVEPLISGCLVQPTFQYVDPEKLPAELTFYVTPLVESGLQATKLQGFLIIKSELGTILQKMPLSNISVVSNRVSKIAAIVGTIGGASLPVMDFLFPLGLQNAVTDQLSHALPEIANSINIRELLTVGQISIFVLCISFGIFWYWRKGRSKLAPREKLSINL
ncbi:MAG: hypothetical protein ACXAC6_05780 [Candidatus Hodarchaeales archaeon]|jgi:hypothetical protein